MRHSGGPAIGEPGMAAVCGFSLLAKLQNHDVAHVEFSIGIERNASLAKIGAGAGIGFFRKKAAAENAQRNGEVDPLAPSTVERWRQLRHEVGQSCSVRSSFGAPRLARNSSLSAEHRQGAGETSGKR